MKKFPAVLVILLVATSYGFSQVKSRDHSVIMYTTAAQSDLRMKETDHPAFASLPQPLESQPCVFLDASKTFQVFIGLGGAITDASAETFAKLTPESQQELLNAYYSSDGIGYTIARTNIHSCDFSSDSYTYVKDNDSLL